MRGDRRAVLDGIGNLYRGGGLAGPGDAALLERFAAGGDAAGPAFAAIVSRHGAMVLGVCRRALGDHHAAEDAFQATFLVLAVRPGSVRRGEALGPWLHGVAARVARRARDAAARRRRREATGPAPEPVAPAGPDPDAAGLRAAIDEELARLPAAYRRAVVLCDLQGLTQPEAARLLGWTRGTVAGRLARARGLLRDRLARRGLAPTAASIASALAAEAVAAPPTALAGPIARAAVAARLVGPEAAGLSLAARSLARECVIMIRLARLRAAAALLTTAGLLAGTLALAFAGPAPAPTQDPPAQAPPPAARPEPPAPELPPEVRRALADGAKYLEGRQAEDGSWPHDNERDALGVTALAALALLAAGRPADAPSVARALDYLERFDAEALGRTYPVSLQTRAFAAADPARYRDRLAANVAWLSKAQIGPDDRNPHWPGGWTYTAEKETAADNSNTHYALLALDAARRAGVAAEAEVWRLAAAYWRAAQRDDGSWGYMRASGDPATGSMTCAGVTGLSAAASGLAEAGGRPDFGPELGRAFGWLEARLSLAENPGRGGLWNYYYRDALSHAARLAGRPRIAGRDWYAEGVAHLLDGGDRDPLTGCWAGAAATERDPIVATSFALLFLAPGPAAD